MAFIRINFPGAAMNNLQLFRRRLIPNECILLKDDVIMFRSDDHIITTWTTLNPKVSFHHGCSCYFLKEGFKLSKFYRQDGSLLYWYCDIVDYQWSKTQDVLTVTDLLADVIIYPDGKHKVVDLDELADALNDGIITNSQLQKSLRRLDKFLSYIYNDNFAQLQNIFVERNL